jgi:hypothetical protein
MQRILSLILILLFVCSACYADIIKGIIEKVDLTTYELTVSGKKVEVSKASIFTENSMNTTKSIIIRDLKDHSGETAVCYGSINKEGAFSAYKVRVIEGHR